MRGGADLLHNVLSRHAIDPHGQTSLALGDGERKKTAPVGRVGPSAVQEI